MKPLVVGLVVSVGAVSMLMGRALAEGPGATEGASPSAAPQAGTSGPAQRPAAPAAKSDQAPATPSLSQSEAQKPAPDPGRVAPPAMIFLEPRLADVQAVRARQLLPVQRGSGVGAADGAPVVAADGLGLELQRTYAGSGGAQ
jgi:hypothetical protein